VDIGSGLGGAETRDLTEPPKKDSVRAFYMVRRQQVDRREKEFAVTRKGEQMSLPAHREKKRMERVQFLLNWV